MVDLRGLAVLLAAGALSGCGASSAAPPPTFTTSNAATTNRSTNSVTLTETIKVPLPRRSSVEGLATWSHFVAWVGCGPCSPDGTSKEVSVYDIGTRRLRVVAHLSQATHELGEVAGAGNQVMWAELAHSLSDGAMTSPWVIRSANLETGALGTVASCTDPHATPPTLTAGGAAFYWVSDCGAINQRLFTAAVGRSAGSAVLGGLRYALPAAGGADVILARSSRPNTVPVPPSDIYVVGPQRRLTKLNHDGFDNTAPDVGGGWAAWSTEGPQGGDPISITAANLTTKTTQTFEPGLWPHVGDGFLAYWPVGADGLRVRALAGGPAKNAVPAGWSSWIPAHFDTAGSRLVFAATPARSASSGSSDGLCVYIESVRPST